MNPLRDFPYSCVLITATLLVTLLSHVHMQPSAMLGITILVVLVATPALSLASSNDGHAT